MVADLLAASRRPLQNLLRDCRFSEWENIALFLDGGATEAVRWAGGLGFVLEELGISLVLDLQAFAPGSGGASRAPGSESVTRGIFLVTTFVWDVEGAVLNAAKTYGLVEVTVACSISEEAHKCHPHAAHISEETGGRISFADVSQQLNVSLVRMLKIEAQSSTASRHRFVASQPSSASFSTPGNDTDALLTSNPIESTHLNQSPSSNVMVTVIHSPLHIGCILQPCISPGNTHVGSFKNASGGPHEACPAFSMASPACARVFPLRRCDWEGGGGSGAGAALFAAAAGVEGSRAEGGTEGRISADEVPSEERLRYRLLAHSLSEVLWEQLQLDVSGIGGVFSVGDTSRLIGTTLAAAAEDAKRAATLPDGAIPNFGGIGAGNSGISDRVGPDAQAGVSTRRREASVVLVDRTLDLTAASTRGGSLLQRIMSSIARTGTAHPLSTSASLPSLPFSLSGMDWSPIAAVHQQDIGVILPSLTPGLGLPVYPEVSTLRATHDASSGASAATPTPGGDGVEMGTSVSVLGRDGPLPESEGQQSRPRVLPAGQGKGEIAGDGGAGRPRLAAMKALAGFPWPAPPSLCHPASAAATAVVHAIAALHEEEGQAALVSALERCIYDNGCIPPPRKRRGMGASIMALVTSLARGNPRKGLSGDRVCFRCRAVVQVALAAMEAHQRTSGPAGSSWAETVGAERVQRQQLRDGGTAEVVMAQLCATLEEWSPAKTGARVGSAYDAMLLALRGVSLAGGGIGAEDATRFRRAWVERMLAGGVSERGSGVPASIAESVKRLTSRDYGSLTKTTEPGFDMDLEAELAGVRLELEDIARERTQRLREATAARAHLSTPALRDLCFEPYTFTAAAERPITDEKDVTDSGGDGDEEGWDDWGDGAADEALSSGHGDKEPSSTATTTHTTQCDTLVGRLTGLLLDRTNPPVPDLHEVKPMSATSVGLGLLSSGLKKFVRMGAAGGSRSKTSRPTERSVVVIFIVGGFTPLELAEVNGVLRCVREARGGLETEIILAGTTVATPDIVYEQIFTRLPAGQV